MYSLELSRTPLRRRRRKRIRGELSFFEKGREKERQRINAHGNNGLGELTDKSGWGERIRKGVSKVEEEGGRVLTEG